MERNVIRVVPEPALLKVKVNVLNYTSFEFRRWWWFFCSGKFSHKYTQLSWSERNNHEMQWKIKRNACIFVHCAFEAILHMHTKNHFSKGALRQQQTNRQYEFYFEKKKIMHDTQFCLRSYDEKKNRFNNKCERIREEKRKKKNLYGSTMCGRRFKWFTTPDITKRRVR